MCNKTSKLAALDKGIREHDRPIVQVVVQVLTRCLTWTAGAPAALCPSCAPGGRSLCFFLFSLCSFFSLRYAPLRTPFVPAVDGKPEGCPPPGLVGFPSDPNEPLNGCQDVLYSKQVTKGRLR